MSEALEGKLLISILAGTTISMMREWVPSSCTVVRSMPNTPSKVRPVRLTNTHDLSVRLTDDCSSSRRFAKA
jgi:pyrroline-5-carboxylate reductase